jgi:hypothetical protein
MQHGQRELHPNIGTANQNLEILLEEFKNTEAGLEQIAAALENTQNTIQSAMTSHEITQISFANAEVALQEMEGILSLEGDINSTSSLPPNAIQDVAPQPLWYGSLTHAVMSCTLLM